MDDYTRVVCPSCGAGVDVALRNVAVTIVAGVQVQVTATGVQPHDCTTSGEVTGR
jgi:hypothetical protein